MLCHQHPDNQALGICTICSKGVCAECEEISDDLLTCGSTSCLDAMEARRIIAKRTSRNVLNWRRSGWPQILAQCVMAIASIVFGVFTLLVADNWIGGGFFLVFGVAYLIWGVSAAFNLRSVLSDE